MKAVLNIDADEAEKIDLLVRIAEEMGLRVVRRNLVDELNFLVSEPSLAEAWNSPEEARWDDGFRHVKK